MRSNLSVNSMNFPQTDYNHLMFYVRLWTPSQIKCLSHSKTLLQVRLELSTSALLCCVLPYKYRTLTDCATGAVDSKAFYQTLWSLRSNFQCIPWNFLKMITAIWCFMLGFGLHRKLNVSRLLKPCSRWGWNSQPRHCSAAYCLISTAHWPIAPLELLTPKHFTKHYCLWVVIFQFIPWTFLKLITAIWCFMLGFGLHRKLNDSRLLKPCSRWGSNSQPQHCSAAYCLISTARWPIAPLELLTQKHFTKHYGLCVVIFQFIPWTFLKLITAIWCFMLGFGLHRKLNDSRLLKPCSRWGSNSQPQHCSAAYCLISTARWPIAPLELLTQKHFTKHYGLCVVIFNVFHEISSKWLQPSDVLC